MKMNKKVLVLTSLIVTSALLAGAAVFVVSNKDNQILRTKAGDEPYVLNITNLSNGNTTIKTSEGNDISFEITHYGNGTFLTDGYIKNVTPISGLESLIVSFETADADLTVSYGWYYGEYYVTDGIVNSGSVMYNFDDQGPSFFKIENKSGATLTTTNIQLAYSCSETEPPEEYSNVQYTLASNGLSYYVSGFNPGITTAIIRSTFNNLPVSSIGKQAFYHCSTLSSITIPDSVQTIGYYAFNGCTSLSSIVIPNSVTSIGMGAFYSCSTLSSVALPSNLDVIETSLFQACIALVSINIPDSVTSIGNSAFQACNQLSYITIPDGVTSIGNSAFSSCPYLTAVFLPNSITTIGNDVFWSPSLSFISYRGTEADWNKISIGSGNDALLSAIVEFESPSNSFEHITTERFSYDLTNDSRVFNLTMIDKTISSFDFSTELPDLTVVSLGEDAFRQCESLTSITIPNSVLYMGAGAFAQCTHLVEVNIPSNIKTLKTNLFDNCSSLQSISIPDSVISIGASAFGQCQKLVFIVIPEGVIAIMDNAFYYCTSLSAVVIPNTVTSIGKSAFKNCPLAMVYYSGTESEWNSIAIGDSNENLINADIEFESVVTSIEHVETEKYSYELTNNNKVLHFKMIDKTITSFVFSTELAGLTVVSLGNDAFNSCSYLNNISVPNTVVAIGYRAFSQCSSLLSIFISDNVKYVGAFAFQLCSSLTIYCQSESQPSTWSSNWNPSARPVEWGYAPA